VVPARRRSHLDIAFGNITTWGQKARGYVSKSRADVLLFAETHLGEKELDLADFRLFMKTAALVFDASAASPTGRGGNHGGTLAAIRKHLEAKLFQGMPQLIDASAVGVRLRGLNVAVIAAYMDDQKDQTFICRANLTKMHCLLTFVKAIGVPFVIAADFNVPPETLRDTTTWLDDMGADIMLAADVQVTCTAGRGRVLDYVVCSRCLMPLLKVEVDSMASWRPHVGLRISLDCTPRAYRVCKLIQPPDLGGLGPARASFGAAMIQAKAVLGPSGVEGPGHCPCTRCWATCCVKGERRLRQLTDAGPGPLSSSTTFRWARPPSGARCRRLEWQRSCLPRRRILGPLARSWPGARFWRPGGR
jgi:hypothetical protein